MNWYIGLGVKIYVGRSYRKNACTSKKIRSDYMTFEQMIEIWAMSAVTIMVLVFVIAIIWIIKTGW